jgi:histidine triad (HIT) family protein
MCISSAAAIDDLDCPFCKIGRGEAPAAIAYQTKTLCVFADAQPIRPGHMQIVPLAHFETFETLPPELASEILHLGQRIARVQKRLYQVDRVGFVFSGFDVPHVHAHLIPLHQKTDLTSMRYFALGSNLPLSGLHMSREARAATAAHIAGALE